MQAFQEVLQLFARMKYKLTANEAIDRVKTKRSKTNPNKGFVKQLKLYQILNYTFDYYNERHKLLFEMILKEESFS